MDDQLLGALLCIGEKSANTKASLQLSEKFAEDIAKEIKRHPAMFRAA